MQRKPNCKIIAALQDVSPGIILTSHSQLIPHSIHAKHQVVFYKSLSDHLDLFINRKLPYQPATFEELLYAIAEFLSRHNLNYNIQKLYNQIDHYYNHYSNKLVELGALQLLVQKIIIFIEDKCLYFKSKCQQEAVSAIIKHKSQLPIYAIIPHLNQGNINRLIDHIKDDDKSRIINLEHDYYDIDSIKDYNSNNIHIIQSSSGIEEVEAICDVISKKTYEKITITTNDIELATQLEIALRIRNLNINNTISSLDKYDFKWLLIIGQYLTSDSFPISTLTDVFDDSLNFLEKQKNLFRSKSNFDELLQIHLDTFSSITGDAISLQIPMSNTIINHNIYLDLISLIINACPGSYANIRISSLENALDDQSDLYIIAGTTFRQLHIGSYLLVPDSQAKKQQQQDLLYTIAALMHRNIILSYSGNDPVYYIEMLDNTRKDSIQNEGKCIIPINIVEKNPIYFNSINIPLDKLPKKISVTAVEKLIKDPYAYYVSNILKLNSIVAEDEKLEQLFGIIMHEILNQNTANIEGLECNVYIEAFMSCYAKLIDLYQIKSKMVLSTWPLKFKRIARWFYNYERAAAIDRVELLLEQNFTMDLRLADDKILALTCRIDRIDIMKDGSIKIVDYKSGYHFSKKETEIGHKSQLILEGLILLKNGLKNYKFQAENLRFIYLFLNGRNEIGMMQQVNGDLLAAEIGLYNLLNKFWAHNNHFFLSDEALSSYINNEYLHFLRLQYN